MKNIFFSLVIFFSMLTTLGLTLYLTKHYLKAKNKVKAIFYGLITLLMTFSYFTVGEYLFFDLMNNLIVIVVLILILLLVLAFVCQLDMFGYRLNVTLTQMDKTLEQSHKEINEIRKRIKVINRGYLHPDMKNAIEEELKEESKDE